jgi:hypothetical protein
LHNSETLGRGLNRMAKLHDGVRVRKLQPQKILYCSPKHPLRMDDRRQQRRKPRPVQREDGQGRPLLLLEREIVQGEKRLPPELKNLQRIRPLLADLAARNPQMSVQFVAY